MSKKQFNVGSKPEDKVTENSEAVETTEEVTETVEETIEQTEPVNELEEEVTEKKVLSPNDLTEEEQLIQELKIKPIGRDVATGRMVYPSTPLMRRMKEVQERNAVYKNTDEELVELIKSKNNEVILERVEIKYLIATLSEYLEKMSPNNSIDEVKAGEQQVKLARLYDAVLGYEPELSLICLDIITSVFKNNIQTVFSERLALRAINTMKVNPDQSYRFQTLTALFTELGRGTKRDEIGEKLNVRRLMDFISDKNAKANLSEFLS